MTDFNGLTRREFLEVAALIGGFFATRGILDVAKWSEDYVSRPELPFSGGLVQTSEGRSGSGKTLAMTALAYNQYKKYGCRIISDYKLSFPHELFELENIESYENSLVLLDAPYKVLDSRAPIKEGDLAGYLLSQTRKRNNIISLAMPRLDFLDSRVRRMVDVRNKCRYSGGTVHLLSTNLANGDRYKLVIESKSSWNLFSQSELIYAKVVGG